MHTSAANSGQNPRMHGSIRNCHITLTNTATCVSEENSRDVPKEYSKIIMWLEGLGKCGTLIS